MHKVQKSEIEQKFQKIVSKSVGTYKVQVILIVMETHSMEKVPNMEKFSIYQTLLRYQYSGEFTSVFQ